MFDFYPFKSRRMELGLSQSDLSQLTGLSVPFIQKIEYGQTNPSISNLEKIARVLGFEISLEEREVNWPLLVAAGLPLAQIKPTSEPITKPRLFLEMKLAWKMSLIHREREALGGMILAIQRHYPSVWKKNFDASFDLSSMDSGRLLKLSRMSLARLSELL